MKISPKMLAVLVFVSGLVMIAYQVYELNETRKEVWGMKPQQRDVAKPSGPPSAVLLGRLGKENLMGVPKKPRPAGAAPVNAVDTNLKLELIGTIRGGPGGRDSALVQAKGKETKRYYLGDQMDGGAVLNAVHEDYVLIKRGDKLETLRYSMAEPSSALNQSAPVAAPVMAAGITTPIPGLELSPEEEAAWQKPKTARERLKLRQQLIEAKKAKQAEGN